MCGDGPCVGTIIAEDIKVFPVCAGMAPCHKKQRSLPVCVPHMYGDGPRMIEENPAAFVCSPCVRGWPFVSNTLGNLSCVFPVRSGMVLNYFPELGLKLRVPRVCGDSPTQWVSAVQADGYSPCMRGWPHLCVSLGLVRLVFPVCTGMALCDRSPMAWTDCVPRVCGDGPNRVRYSWDN